jgi:GxxExxY protein
MIPITQQNEVIHLNYLSTKVIGTAIHVHTTLGPGLLESCYKECLFYKLIQSGLYVEKERPMPVIFEGVKFECGYRIDLLVKINLSLKLKA